VSIVDHPAFRAFLADIDPKYVPPVRQTVTNSLLPQLLQSQQAKLTTLLQQCSDVSLTCDIWTDSRMHSFLGVTAHVFVSGHPASYLLAFRSLTGSHTGQRIAQALESVITECGLQNKIRCIVTDNASNMKKLCRWCLRYMMIVSQPMVRLMIQQYGKMRRWPMPILIMRLSTFHALLTLSSWLSETAWILYLLSDHFLQSAVSWLTNLIHQSTLFRGIYEQTMQKIVPSANETRWNSTYHQLKVVSDLDHIKLNDLLRGNGHENLIPMQKICPTFASL